MVEILSTPNADKIVQFLDIAWKMSPSEKADFDNAMKSFKGVNAEQLMEDYLREHGFIN